LKGKVYLIGAGPGHPDLLTLRAVDILKKSEVILYDRLIDSQVLDYAGDAEKIDVGKIPGESSKQDEINNLLFSKAKDGKVVARIKNGNPVVFGRGGEEIQFLQERGIEVEVVPGLSSATSLPPLLGIPLTKRGVSSSITILTGVEAGGKDPTWTEVGDTAVVLMTVGNLSKVVEKLLISGKSRETPSALISSGTRDDERILLSPLSEIVDLAELVGIAPPAILVSGEVVRELLRLKGRRVAIFRPDLEEDRTEALIEKSGGIPLFYNVCRIEDSDNPELRNALEEDWDALIFMSPNGVRSAAELVDFDRYKIMAVGNRTKAVLEKFGAEEIILPSLHSSEGIENLLKEKSWKSLALRSSLAEKDIEGAKNVTAYSVIPKDVAETVKSYLRSNPEYTILTSSGILKILMEAAHNEGLKEDFKEKLNESFLITIGRKTTKSALNENLTVKFELTRPDLKNFFEEVVP